jgi:hypothetical protein
LLLLRCVGKSKRCEKQRQKCCADNSNSFHRWPSGYDHVFARVCRCYWQVSLTMVTFVAVR